MKHFRSLAAVLVFSQCTMKCRADGLSDCTCIGTEKNQTAASGVSNNSFVTNTTYGYGCKAHDDGKGLCQGSSKTADGQDHDWCKDKWCIVDKNNCSFKTRAVTYTADANDYFSYETCNSTFAGNGWVGRVKCVDMANSYCTEAYNNATKGDASCPCVTTTKNQLAAPGKLAYVNNTKYGYFCQAHDDGKGSCSSSNKTTAGQADDWCKDKWCIVDPKNCAFKVRAVSYTLEATDYFSYETCDKANFVGNGWVGREKCLDKDNSYCAAQSAQRGDASCPCVTTTKQQTATNAVGTPDYVSNTTYGYFCHAHDNGLGACAKSANTADGKADDWCLDKWCIVDPSNCSLKARAVTFTTDTGDYFSYKTCDNANFKGNNWVGTEKCKNSKNSYCSSAENAITGHSSCLCVATALLQTAATDKPTYVTGTEYGYGCKAHDQGKDTCANSTKTADGQADDWCLDKWCIVDRNNCSFKTRAVTYTAAAGDYFSYETCATNFKGNGWVGRAKCTDKANSYCADSGKGGAGDASCPCVTTAKTQTAAKDKPAFVTGTEYGYGCKTHDDGKGTCANSTKTADGQDDDWCKDQWCIVDVSNCTFKTRAVTYTEDANDYFSYKTCDAANFKGNGWVGREACKDNANSYCTKSENGNDVISGSNNLVSLSFVSLALLIMPVMRTL